MNQAISRRVFLKWMGAGMGLASLSLSRMALANTPPRRVIFVFFPDGMRPQQWHAQGTGTQFSLPVMTAPLERVKQHCIFLSGINMFGPGSTHEGGVAKWLTGAAGLHHDNVPSLDFFLGQQFRHLTIRPHLNLNIVPVWQGGHFTFDERGTPMIPEPNPLAAFDSLFSNQVNNQPNQPRLSALAAARTELNTLRSQLGATEAHKLDTHLDSLQELEQRLTATLTGCPTWNFNPTGFTVTRTGFWQNPEYRDASRMGLIGELHMDVAVRALACDLSRVVTLKWGHSVNEAVISEAGSSQTCHQASHGGGQDFVQIKAWYAEQLARLIEKLAAIPEGNGSLLDNTLIFVGSDISHGGWHDHNNMPFILAGGQAGGMLTGRSLHYNNVPHNKLLVSIAQFMGVDIHHFGTQDPNPSALAGLIA